MGNEGFTRSPSQPCALTCVLWVIMSLLTPSPSLSFCGCFPFPAASLWVFLSHKLYSAHCSIALQYVWESSFCVIAFHLSHIHDFSLQNKVNMRESKGVPLQALWCCYKNTACNVHKIECFEKPYSTVNKEMYFIRQGTVVMPYF